MWQAFPYMVLMDATYKTNKYNLPFLEIVGVTSMRLTFSIAFTFMHSEKQATTEHALDKILEELHRLKGFVPILENCGCQLLACFGLPYAHELAMYVDAGSHIPLDSIDIFWRTLDFKPCVCVDYGNLYVDDHMKRWKEKFNNQQIMSNIVMLSSSFFDLNDEPTRHNSSFFDLNDESNTHNSSFFDLNDEPVRHSSFFMGMNEEPIGQFSYRFDLNEEPTCQWSYQFDLKEEAPMEHSSLLKEISSVFHSYITRIQNVMGDGNCGFRSIAICLRYDENEFIFIRRQLYDELLTSYEDYSRVFIRCDGVLDSLSFFMTYRTTLPEHYILLPDIGILIANRFGVIVQFFTTVGSVTFFPLRRCPSEFQNHCILTFALVYTNHYVMVQLEGEYSMPPISALWIRHKDPSATE
uniref:MULE transposase domain-containing protein n=1 Tax=Lactuca sativa TaxID=4236 RepID=A0A9R1XGW7_LACSA|nr:hypothetical protein LSAT_V11C400223670 [Lactuca sativa]